MAAHPLVLFGQPAAPAAVEQLLEGFFELNFEMFEINLGKLISNINIANININYNYFDF